MNVFRVEFGEVVYWKTWTKLSRLTFFTFFPHCSFLTRCFRVQASLGILHNCLRHFDSNKLIVRENNGINNLIKYYDSTYLIIKSKIMIVLAYCVNDKENETLTTGKLLRFSTLATSRDDHFNTKLRCVFLGISQVF